MRARFYSTALGRMTSKTEGATQTLTYNDAAHVHAVSQFQEGASPPVAPAYDANGNMTGLGDDSYVYDADNRLVSRTEGGETVEYAYDGQGNLVKKASSDGTWTLYIGDLYEKRSDGSYVNYYRALGRRIAMRVHQPGDPVGVVRYLLADHLGSSTQIIDSSGTLLESVKYYPYGSVREGGMTGTDKLFTGQQEEGTAFGLYNYGARFYSTKLGRFLSADPLVVSPGDPQMLDRYAYVRNNPLRYVDPTGLGLEELTPEQAKALVAWGEGLMSAGYTRERAITRMRLTGFWADYYLGAADFMDEMDAPPGSDFEINRGKLGMWLTALEGLCPGCFSDIRWMEGIGNDYGSYGGIMGDIYPDPVYGMTDRQRDLLLGTIDMLGMTFSPYEIAAMPWAHEVRFTMYFWRDIPTDYLVGNILYQFRDMGAYSTYFLTTGCPGELGCGVSDPRDTLKTIGLLPVAP